MAAIGGPGKPVYISRNREVEVREVVDNLPALIAEMEALAGTSVLVGIPEATAGRGPMTGGVADKPLSSTGGGIADNNAALAYIHEHGSPAAHIPPRPFLVPGIKEAVPRMEPHLRQAAAAALQLPQPDGRTAEKELHAVGLICQAAVRRQITTGQFAPLAESTLAARRRRGRSGTKPLLDSGRLRQAVTYAIEQEGSRTFTQPLAGGDKYSQLIKGKGE